MKLNSNIVPILFIGAISIVLVSLVDLSSVTNESLPAQVSRTATLSTTSATTSPLTTSTELLNTTTKTITTKPTATTTSPTFFQSVTTSIKNLLIPTVKTKTVVPVAKTLSGTFLHTHFDDFENGKEIPMYQLITDNGIISLDLGTMPESMFPESGSKIEVTGIEQQNKISLTDPNAIKVISKPIATTNNSRSTGPKKLSIVLYKFANTTANPPFTTEDVRKNFFEPNAETGITMSEFLSLSSYGKLTLEGKTSVDGTTDVYGWYTVSLNRNGCDIGQYITAGKEAIDMAIQDGLAIDTSIDYIATGTYPEECPTGGAVTTFSENGLNQLLDIVVMRNIMSWSNTLHEFGHIARPINDILKNNGHSNTLECVNNKGVPLSFGSRTDCSVLEYGSPLSVLGGFVSGAFKTRLLDSFNRLSAEFLDDSNIIVVPNSGNYDIKKINYPDAQILRIPYQEADIYVNNKKVSTDVTSYIDVSSRDFLTFEQDIDTFPHRDVVTLTNVTPYSASLLHNVTPSAKNRNLLSPNEATLVNILNARITNYGPSLNDPKKIKIGVEYLTTERKMPDIKLTTSTGRNQIVLKTNGNFISDPLIIKNDSYKDVSIKLDSTIAEIYPGNFPRTDFFNEYQAWLNLNRSNRVLYRKHYIISNTQPLSIVWSDGIIMSSSNLGSQRFIQQIEHQLSVDRVQRNIGYNYVIYGDFTTQELMKYGVISQIQNSGLVPTKPSDTTSVNPVSNTQLIQ